MKLDERIKVLRQDRGLSQVELAKVLNVTKQSVSNWENNSILPSIDMLVRLATYFSVSTDYLLGLDDRDYIEITGLSNSELSHIRLVINDIVASRFSEGIVHSRNEIQIETGENL